jgi:hypothetical protein
MGLQSLRGKYKNPVVIGGIGGSGTRLFAQCLNEAGYFIGHDLNQSKDNLLFSLLFNRSEILSASKEEFEDLVEILFSGMTGANELTRSQIELVNSIASKDRKQDSASWLKKRVKILLSKKPEMKLDDRWGLKNPISHIVIDRLKERFDNLKYIHVVRNGLDMAHSKNQNQLKYWGPSFINESINITPYYALKYWCIVHRRILEIGKTMGTNFLFLNYDNVCLHPEEGINLLCNFLGLKTNDLANQLVKLIQPPDTIGRFKKHGTRIFSKDDVSYVKHLGFDVGI